MQSAPIGIVGASGYSGLELSRILALHPRVELKLLGSDKWAGETAARALAPLIEAGMLAADRLIVDAASGVTGAGRKASEDFSFAEIDGDFRAYKVLRHQHQPEIAQTLGRPLVFTPHLLPVKRGILATCYARLAAGKDPQALRAALLHKYAGAPFVEVLETPDQVSLKGVTGTNQCQIAVASEGGMVVAIAAI